MAFSIKNDWATPPDFLARLNEVWKFQFDPCPLCHDTSEWDGLTVDWKERNFVNPPYSRLLKEKFIAKCVEEKKKGNLSVVLIPSYTSTKLFHNVILPNCNYIFFLKDRLAFKNPHHDTNGGKSSFSNMLVIFDGRPSAIRCESVQKLFDLISRPYGELLCWR